MPRYQEKKKSKTPIIIIVIFVLILAAGGGVIFFNSMNSPTELGQEVSVTIPEGSGTKAIAKILEENGVISSAFGFTTYVKKEDAATSLKPGTYTFGPGEVTNQQIVDSLLKGGRDENTINVTVPEGLTVLQTAELFTGKGMCTTEEFLNYAASMEIPYDYIPKGSDYNQLEGFLFPETYNLGKDWGAKEIIDTLLKQFDKSWTDEMQAKADGMGMSVKDIVTVASLVEREAKIESERPLIAGVIYNRINAGMKLQIDATVQYALGEQKERLLYKDLEIDSPYNTYKYAGLPPGPIASPGLSCIDAALNPEASKYLFYQTSKEGDGSHYFCETYEEHLAYRAKK